MNRGRPRNFEPDLVLENAMQLFWSQGYEATSLQDLLLATGLSKSSLYESFGNKQSLFEAAFTRYFDIRARQMRERLEQAESPLGYIRGACCPFSTMRSRTGRVAACCQCSQRIFHRRSRRSAVDRTGYTTLSSGIRAGLRAGPGLRRVVG